MRVVMGIDASLTSTGLVALATDWGLDWSRVARTRLGLGLSKSASELDRIRRLDAIAAGVLAFVAAHGVTDVFMEQYAFSARASQSHALGEIGGVIKRDVALEAGLPLTVVPPATARALLGRFSAHAKKGSPKPLPVKDQVHAVLYSAGMPHDWCGDEIDAWVVANWGLSGIAGADALIVPEAT